MSKIDDNITLDDDDNPLPAAGVSWIPDAQDLYQQRLGSALYRLQQWLMEMYQRKYAEDDGGMVRLNPEVSGRFALGLQPKEAFIVMPELETGWASLIPWSHAAMHPNDPTIFLVTENFEIDGEMTPDFGISFQIPDFAKAQSLSERPRLQLRSYVLQDQKWTVSSSAFADMPLVILEGRKKAFDKKGRKLKFKGRLS